MRTANIITAILVAVVLGLVAAPAFGQATVDKTAVRYNLDNGFVAAFCPATDGAVEVVNITRGFLDMEQMSITPVPGSATMWRRKIVWNIIGLGSITGATYRANQMDTFILIARPDQTTQTMEPGHLVLHRLGPSGEEISQVRLIYNTVIEYSEGVPTFRVSNMKFSCQ